MTKTDARKLARARICVVSIGGHKVHNNCAWIVKTWDADRVIYRESRPYSFFEALAVAREKRAALIKELVVQPLA